jgi:hypothetical protein
MSNQERKDESGKKGRRPGNAGQKEFSGKKQSSSDGKDAPPTRKREETTGLHRSETENSIQTKQKIDSGKRTSDGRMDKP